MKFLLRIFILILSLLICISITSCNSNKKELIGLWKGTQADINVDSEVPLEKFDIYYFHEDNKIDLGNYDYSSEDFNHNYAWVEKGIKYEWLDKNSIDIKYKGSNIFDVKIKGSKVVLTSKDYSISFTSESKN
ncbi:hypothetical protein SH2C18_50410 [Clostridium sediminicola]|uniref:hypothetical protein n=1 Tax=Clostridium sediminicola TaxID=3114879 RepID=UPI0031F23B1E